MVIAVAAGSPAGHFDWDTPDEAVSLRIHAVGHAPSDWAGC